jgi:hypothetical protein
LTRTLSDTSILAASVFLTRFRSIGMRFVLIGSFLAAVLGAALLTSVLAFAPSGAAFQSPALRPSATAAAFFLFIFGLYVSGHEYSAVLQPARSLEDTGSPVAHAPKRAVFALLRTPF